MQPIPDSPVLFHHRVSERRWAGGSLLAAFAAIFNVSCGAGPRDEGAVAASPRPVQQDPLPSAGDDADYSLHVGSKASTDLYVSEKWLATLYVQNPHVS